MNNNFLVFPNIYDCTGYFIGFTFSEKVVLLAFASHLSFEFIKLSIKAPLVFAGKLMFFKCSCQKPFSENCVRPVF